MIRLISLFSVALMLCCTPLFAQQLNHVQGEILVQFKPGVNAQRWAQRWQTFEGKPTSLKADRLVSAPVRIWAMSFNFDEVPESQFLQALRRSPDVEVAQFNHLVRMRSTIPDDPGFGQQWQYLNMGQSGGTAGADIDMDLAWDITTGGVTVEGDTIVVCAVDDGIDLNHQDFGNNLWINHAEIPDNELDDDGNGYVDDYRGWSITSDSDNISGGGHGTPVAGIMGAKGNNGLGVAGVSWNVKLMIVKNNFNTNEAAVLEAYSYPLIQRMIYNETDGQKGAFVVAANSSWGTDFGDPADAPLWCAFYDTLGVHGIISCGATANANVNVDVQGDLPTGCSSDYLIAVTNMNHNDQKVTSAGYGTVTIDLGAFGANTWTTAQGNGYGPFGGTSGATPHVTGAIGLLYSAPCPSFIAIAKSDPAAAALLAKQYILQGVDPNASLAGITTTGGRLNVNNSLTLLMQNCGACPPPTSVVATGIRDTEATLSWNVTDSVNTVDLLWRVEGDTVWNVIPQASSPYVLGNLWACTAYEVQLHAYCNGDTSQLFNNFSFKTDGCCEIPVDLSAFNLTDTSVYISWADVLAAQGFILRIREEGAPDWNELVVASDSILISGLNSCTRYAVQVSTICDTIATDFSAPIFFRTLGCGACLDLPYCIVDNLNASEEWINFFEFATVSNTSNTDNGYGNFTDSTATILELGAAYNIRMQPGYSGTSYQEYFKIWIDYNQDGDFSADEVAYDAGSTTTTMLEGVMNIPPDAPLGATRLRLVMNFLNADVACNFESGTYGEVEDYCVEIVPTSNCAIPLEVDTLAVDYFEAELGWENIGPAISYLVRYREVGQTIWDTLSTSEPGIMLSALGECKDYEAQIGTICGYSLSELSEPFIFRTACVTGVLPEPAAALWWRAMPNPFRDEITVDVELPKAGQTYLLEYFDARGQRRGSQSLYAEGRTRQQIRLATTQLEAGVYLIRITDAEGRSSVRKVVKE